MKKLSMEAFDRLDAVRQACRHAVSEAVGAVDGFLAECVRQYCREQKVAWQSIPLLALELDARQSSTIQNELAYKEGIWVLNEDVHIDLATGEPVFFSPIVYPLDRMAPCKDRFLAPLIFQQQGKLDAFEVIAHLRAAIAEEPKRPDWEDWFRQQCEVFDVKPDYVRPAKK